jgi:hypothetical protein
MNLDHKSVSLLLILIMTIIGPFGLLRAANLDPEREFFLVVVVLVALVTFHGFQWLLLMLPLIENGNCSAFNLLVGIAFNELL